MNSQNPSDFYNLQDLQRLFDIYRGQTEQLLQYAKEHHDEKAQEALLRVKQRLHQGPVRALVLGASSAGKSTLINALAGDIVTPEGEHTTSPIPVWVYNRQADSSAQICLLQKNSSDIQEHTCGLYTYIRDYCYTAQEAGQGNGQERFQDLIAATANLRSSDLANYGITLIDTPGSGVSSLDNQRAQRIIQDGCELLIIVAKNFQNQDIQSYFQQLLIPPDAPFHSLLGKTPTPKAQTKLDDGSDADWKDELESDWDDSLKSDWDDLDLALVEESDEPSNHSRVFMVVNCFKNADHKTLQTDTELQLRISLPDWDHQGHLFVLNARDARYQACGYYPHCNLLPSKYSDETWDYAVALQEEEKEELEKHARQAKDWAATSWDYPDATITMEQLCDALYQAAEDLCQDPEAIAQLLAPIHTDMSIAIQSLEAPILERYQAAEERTYEAPSEWLDEKKLLEQRHQDLNLCMESFRNTLYGLSAFSESKWPLDNPLKKIYTEDYLLLAEDRGAADRYMQQVIQEDNGPEKLTLHMKSRLPKRLDLLCQELADPSKNPEIEHWQDSLTALFQKVRSYNVLSSHTFVMDSEITRCEDHLNTHFEDAKRAGHSALKKSNIFSLSDPQKEDLLNYLKEKKTKVDAGGFGKGWAKFWLWPNTSANKLIPLLDPMIAKGSQLYTTAYRQHLSVMADTQFHQFGTLIHQLIVGVNQRLKQVDKNIVEYNERTKQNLLTQIDNELTALRNLYSMTTDSKE